MNFWLTMREDHAAFQALSDDAKLMHLERMAAAPDPEVRSRVLILAQQAKFGIGQLWEQLASDSDEGVRFMAMNYAFYLGSRMGSRAVASRVMEMLVKDPDEFVRSQAALAVRSVCTIDDLAFLESRMDQVTGVNHEDTPIRSTLIRSMNIIRGDEQD